MKTNHYNIAEDGSWVGDVWSSTRMDATASKNRKEVDLTLHKVREYLGVEATEQYITGITLDKHKLGRLIESLRAIHAGLKY